jgi:hypothetical protein
MAKTKKVKMTNNDLQNATQKTKDGATRTPLVRSLSIIAFHFISK